MKLPLWLHGLVTGASIVCVAIAIGNAERYKGQLKTMTEVSAGHYSTVMQYSREIDALKDDVEIAGRAGGSILYGFQLCQKIIDDAKLVKP